ARFGEVDTRPSSGKSVNGIGGAGGGKFRKGAMMAWSKAGVGRRTSVESNVLLGDVMEEGVESEEDVGMGAAGGGEGPVPVMVQQVEEVRPVKVQLTRRKKISINAVRMARSPLADAVLPPPQRFLFVQTRPELIGNLVGV
ncbi:hypothetical protein HK097_005891, partial [Rhizophlyctis rosea]